MRAPVFHKIPNLHGLHAKTTKASTSQDRQHASRKGSRYAPSHPDNPISKHVVRRAIVELVSIVESDCCESAFPLQPRRLHRSHTRLKHYRTDITHREKASKPPLLTPIDPVPKHVVCTPTVELTSIVNSDCCKSAFLSEPRRPHEYHARLKHHKTDITHRGKHAQPPNFLLSNLQCIAKSKLLIFRVIPTVIAVLAEILAFVI